MKFSYLASYFDKISQISSRIEITKLLAELYKSATPKESYIISYLSLGTLRAPYHGSQFNFAEKNILKILPNLLKIDEKECKLIIKETGDIGSCITADKWPFEDAGLTVGNVYNDLVQLEKISGVGSQEEKSQYLINLLSKLDYKSAEYVIKIIVGTMRLGFSDMTIIDALSWMIAGDKSLHNEIEDAYNVCADIGLIASKISESGIKGITHMEPTIGIPIRPAAAERLPNAAAIFEKLGPCVAQLKLDGFRLQVHIGDKEIYFFSRNLQDMSNMFPDLVEAFKNLKVKNLIVEGEAIVYDEQTESFLPFQETVKRKRKHNIEEVAQEMPLKLFLFDILYLDNKNLMGLSHAERREVLEDLSRQFGKHSAISVIEEKKIDSAKELEDFFNKQFEKGLEGVVVKRPDSPYKPGKRNFNWIKLKRHSEGHLDDSIDTVILGYYYGMGKRAKFGIGAFLVGVYNKELDRFDTIAKVGTGLKDADWIDLKEKCDKIHVKEKPHNVNCAPELSPDVWVNPELVAIILADEITQSPLHTATYALRFPRFMGYSLDKSPELATSLDEIKKLFQQQYS